MEGKQRALLAASVAGILAVGGMLGLGQTVSAEGEGEKAHCYGVNKCKGTGDCGGKGHACAGKNACKGQGFIQIPENACMRIEGGTLTPPEGT